MFEWARWLLSGLPLMVLAAISTHLVVSISQTLFHYGLGPWAGLALALHDAPVGRA